MLVSPSLDRPIAHALVTAHTGHITLDTAPGHGCAFRILLPLPDLPQTPTTDATGY
ncbi:ATP-binding protein [Streptomyces sp. 135]|uniref:ATP-binding protein n=1 Tax=Streptomyces sp. 135 TaxID=2838850 RepID=UPI001CBA9069|nr:ATP-binding protein [Streptomyces sp. 135]